MSLFLLTYFAVYGGMTAYAAQRFWRGLGGPVRVWLPLGIGAVVMMLLPMLLHRLEGRLGPLSGRLLTGSGWIWLALVFWAFCAFLAIDLWNVAATAAGLMQRAALGWRLSPRTAAIAVLALLPLLCLWGWIEGGIVRLRTVTIASARLPPSQPPVRLLQVSDMHIGRTSRPAVWRRVLALVRAAEPDLLVSTGDLVDASDRFVDDWIRELAAIRPRLGKYAVLGNHEFYPGVERTLAFLEAGGFETLRGRGVDVGAALRVVGVDDPEGRRHDGTAVAEADLLPASPVRPFTVLLKHRPEVSAAARRHCDLQLSGHTHAGQILPFRYAVRLVYPHPHSRLVEFAEGLRLYVSPGTGTWGPPFRFLAPGELTLFILRPATPGPAALSGS